MRFAVLAIALLIAACGDEPVDDRREVEKPARQHDFAPMYAIDEALRTEAMAMFATLNRQIMLAATRQGDRAAFYRSLEGPLTAAKLETIGMTESNLKGTHYVASDYAISIAGNEMTITAAKPGTRGHTSGAYPLR